MMSGLGLHDDISPLPLPQRTIVHLPFIVEAEFSNEDERVTCLILLYRLNKVAPDSKNLRQNIVLAQSNRSQISRVPVRSHHSV
ncbi:MAG: hypothetical protein DI543_04390 [Bradyrhizobium icense]|jgi:hypothetical protein|nr:MAG: hypothetical protein DI543_04390 [Bradyrhizobium icense]